MRESECKQELIYYNNSEEITADRTGAQIGPARVTPETDTKVMIYALSPKVENITVVCQKKWASQNTFSGVPPKLTAPRNGTSVTFLGSFMLSSSIFFLPDGYLTVVAPSCHQITYQKLLTHKFG